MPVGWMWCRLKDLFNVCSAKRVLQSEWKKEGIPFYRAREIVKLSNNGFVDNDLFISLEHYETLKNSYGVPQAGDLMVTGVGTIGKVYIVQENDTFYYKDASVLCFENLYGAIIPEYARIMIDSPLLQEQIHSKTYGNTVDTITISTANEYLCVLPPINEQHKIIEAVKSVLEVTDIIEDGYEELSTCIVQAKSKILDLAIRGKLVPQNPDDEPASVLLKRIRAEKEELIRQGKIKRDKKESVIFKGEDNSYYDMILPANWNWSSISEISLGIVDGSHNPPPNSFHGIPILSAVNIYENRVNYNSATRWITEEEWTLENKRTNIENGDVLLTIVGSIGRTAIVTDSIKFALQRSVAVIKPCMINSGFLMYTLQSPMINEWLISNAKGNAQLGIYLKDLAKLIIPLPPIEEQFRIVETIEKVFARFDSIIDSLN